MNEETKKVCVQMILEQVSHIEKLNANAVLSPMNEAILVHLKSIYFVLMQILEEK